MHDGSRGFGLFWNAICFGIVLECKTDLDFGGCFAMQDGSRFLECKMNLDLGVVLQCKVDQDFFWIVLKCKMAQDF